MAFPPRSAGAPGVHTAWWNPFRGQEPGPRTAARQSRTLPSRLAPARDRTRRVHRRVPCRRDAALEHGTGPAMLDALMREAGPGHPHFSRDFLCEGKPGEPAVSRRTFLSVPPAAAPWIWWPWNWRWPGSHQSIHPVRTWYSQARTRLSGVRCAAGCGASGPGSASSARPDRLLLRFAFFGCCPSDHTWPLHPV